MKVLIIISFVKLKTNFNLDFWITKQILPKDVDKTKVVKTTLRELIVYIAFLITITYSINTKLNFDIGLNIFKFF